MTIVSTLKTAWRSAWALRKHHAEPAWAVMLAVTLATLPLAPALMGLVAVFVYLEPSDWWRIVPLPLTVIFLSAAYTLLLLHRLVELALPQRVLAQLSPPQGARAALVRSAIFVFGGAFGLMLGGTFVGWLYDFTVWDKFRSLPVALLRLTGFLSLIALANLSWWRLRVRQESAQRQATEAQLRLLQAQIEPHFLFNTLANVQSLMDYDTPRAKQMLEAFSDYLRSSLTQLRDVDSTLAFEMETARNYLELLQIRMGERLAFTFDVSTQAQAAVLPTLLLQPLVENAIQHGLEPKVEGGVVRVSAEVEGVRLRLTVDDDGLGLDAPRRHGRSGNGMALANLRARLQTRYGKEASLRVEARAPGTRSIIELPFTATP
ncbi:MAG: sensor histidine kinase [Pseudomonadota bacterium]